MVTSCMVSDTVEKYDPMLTKIDSTFKLDQDEKVMLRLETIFNALRTYKPEKGMLSTLLWTIHRNECVRYVKKRDKSLGIKRVYQEPMWESSVESDLDFEEIVGRLDNKEDRQLVRERYKLGLTYADMAKKYKISHQACRMRLLKCLRELKYAI